MDALVDEGFIVLAGTLADEYRNVHVVDAESELEVRDTFARDPWIGYDLANLTGSTLPMELRLDGRPPVKERT